MAPSLPRRPPSSLVEYGAIGDCHTAALVSRHGSIDWLCWPRLDSPSVFAALLDPQRGGHMTVQPLGEYRTHQSYEPDTNILRTEFETPTGRVRLTDFMPVEEIDREDYNFQEVHRLLEGLQGTVEGQAEFHPLFDYGRAKPRLATHPNGILAEAGKHRLVLASDVSFHAEGQGAAATWRVASGEAIRFVLRHDTAFIRTIDEYQTLQKLETTRDYWRRWANQNTYTGPYRDAVRRSALALKLLTYAPTGAFAAAITTSLPETPGGPRNWDYRYSWIRDGCFAMEAFHGLGYTLPARRYLRWLRRLLRGLTRDPDELRVLYGLEGETELPEETLDHLSGYLDSRPVRIGNAASTQRQHDIYGALANALYEAYKRPEGYPDEAWRTIRALAEHVLRIWDQPDQGIWEVRGPMRRYTHSALMCWVVLDRAIKIAEARGHAAYAQHWGTARNAIRNAIETQAWNPGLQSFVMDLGGSDLDASLLAMPLVGFLPPNDPRIQATLATIDRELGSGPFIHRYRIDDGFDGREGAFLILSFWMVRALVLSGRIQEAESRYRELLALAGPLGLYSEQVDPATRTSLGNFPQAFTHLAVINCALALEQAQRARASELPATKH